MHGHNYNTAARSPLTSRGGGHQPTLAPGIFFFFFFSTWSSAFSFPRRRLSGSHACHGGHSHPTHPVFSPQSLRCTHSSTLDLLNFSSSHFFGRRRRVVGCIGRAGPWSNEYQASDYPNEIVAADFRGGRRRSTLSLLLPELALQARAL